MRIVTSLFERIAGIELFPIISLIIFLTVFAFALIYALTMKRQDSKEYSSFPLEENNTGTHKDIS